MTTKKITPKEQAQLVPEEREQTAQQSLSPPSAPKKLVTPAESKTAPPASAPKPPVASSGNKPAPPTHTPKPPFKPAPAIRSLDPRLAKIGGLPPAGLAELAIELKIKDLPEDRDELVLQLINGIADKSGHTIGAGLLDIGRDGYGFLRAMNGAKTQRDIYIGRHVVRRHGLRQCDQVAGVVAPPRGNARQHSIDQVLLINGRSPGDAPAVRRHFDKLDATYPDERIKLENKPNELSTRLIDLIAPIGKGQRALIVAPPKAGKTVLLKQIANAIRQNHPELKIIVSLIGERPEEVTDIRRSIVGEIYHSTFDEPVEDHTRVAEMGLERARRLVEQGKDVVMLLDSLTRLARAHNIAVPSSGKTLSGGMDPYALYPPKRLFGSARNCETGGSLTIIATVLIETGSRLDDLIYEEFKGTGNMELHLNRSLAERRLFPALDIQRSGTRHEELLLNEQTLSKVWLLRRMVSMVAQDGNSADATGKVVEIMRRTKTNEQFLEALTSPSSH